MRADVSASALVLVQREHDDFFVMRSRDGRYFRLSSEAYLVATHHLAGAPPAAIARTLSSEHGLAIPEAQIARMCGRLDSLVQRQGKRVDSRFLFRAALVPAAVVRRIASRLGFMFSPAAVFIVVTLLATGLILAARTRPALDAGGPQTLCAFLLFLACLLVHEFGHAAAASRAGVEPAEIGLTVFAIFPALYTDVTAAWAAKRRDRVLIDCGGVYFQSAAIGALACAFAATHSQVFVLALVFNLAGAVFSLNPFAKNDGYWILGDALGLANLAASSRRWLLGRFGAFRNSAHAGRRGEGAGRIAAYITFLLCSAATWLWIAAGIGYAALRAASAASHCAARSLSDCLAASGAFTIGGAVQLLLVFFYCAALLHHAAAGRRAQARRD
jgi:putative peptide zinc metalloprotease protein